ncbi:MAG: sugar phosphate isomerase/epimerase [Clostridia bacterium]|nr:sugar phosphate isomerase/epimerase [Clostridia bacterium]
MKTGLTSITFRQFTAEKVIELAKQAGLDGIEWGGDIHARPDNLERAKEVGELTRAAGLEVLSYGSYYFVGKGSDFEPISQTAEALGCSIIRIWMPWDDYDYASHKEEIGRISAIAASRGQTLAFEFHCKTANDLVSRSVAMLNCFGKDNVKTYWQPPYWPQTPPDSLDDLEELVPYVVNLHVYRWKGENNDRLPLAEGARAWANYLQIFKTANAAILEFTRDALPENFLADAKTLHELLAKI